MTDLNSGALADTIRACAEQMIDIKEQRKALNEQAAEIRETLRDSGVQVQAFNFALRLAEMEGQARDTYMQSLAEAHAALDIGGQLDWVSSAANFELKPAPAEVGL